MMSIGAYMCGIEEGKAVLVQLRIDHIINTCLSNLNVI